MLVVRYLIALVFSIFVMATSLRIEERYRRHGHYKISTPNRLVLQMDRCEVNAEHKLLERRQLAI
ncbi:uncharacterized protein LOC6562674 [Drosophila grimshawi]|uniref:GH10303 n=1 Tax=Drosophila grimshawi TaxID=7222 RepID=B4JAE0_DROGR|nr:uncharacterized protein LOC6562674 [Drosophila grimshawi]EDW03811.1 GH10303 [Drosophila grimshawi]